MSQKPPNPGCFLNLTSNPYSMTSIDAKRHPRYLKILSDFPGHTHTHTENSFGVFYTFQTGFRERKVHVIQLKTGKRESIGITFRKLIIISIILCLSFYKFKITLKTASKIFLRRRIACHLIRKWFSIPVILLKG